MAKVTGDAGEENVKYKWGKREGVSKKQQNEKAQTMTPIGKQKGGVFASVRAYCPYSHSSR